VSASPIVPPCITGVVLAVPSRALVVDVAEGDEDLLGGLLDRVATHAADAHDRDPDPVAAGSPGPSDGEGGESQGAAGSGGGREELATACRAHDRLRD
jgi:hypothetical protein